jgi:hypothetical protein
MTGIYSISDLTCKPLQARLFFLLTLLVCSGLISAQEKQAELRELAGQSLAERGEVIFMFIKPEAKSLNYFTSFLSIDRVCDDTVTAYANGEGFRKFLEEEIPYGILQPPSLKKMSFHPVGKAENWRHHYPSYPSYVAIMDSFTITYPGLCRLVEIGTTPENHKLLALEVSNHPGDFEEEPAVLLTSTIHGDEPLGYYLMLRLIEELLVRYETDEQIKRLVDNVRIWINPLSNPDGTYFISDNAVFGATRFNSNSVDLNRNFPDPVYGDHPDSYDWQDETQAMMHFMKGIPLALSANLHGGNEVVNYPWDAFSELHPDDIWFTKISAAFADTAQAHGPPGYMTALNNGITNGYQWYPVHGGRQDYVTYFLHGREVTIELSNDKMPDETSLDDYWNYNRNSLLQYIGQALTGVSGMVSDSATGLPLKAMISIQDHDRNSTEVYSDSLHGDFYRLTDAGNYTFEINATGYHEKKIPAVVTSGQLTRLNVKLSALSMDMLYPNPFKDVLYVNLEEAGEEIVLDFSDLSGRKAKHITQPVTVAGKQEILVTGLAPGVYIVSIRYKNLSMKEVVVRK